MKLHNSKEDFHDAIIAASNHFRVSPAIVEKDYYVTIVLERLKNLVPGIMFKGGTSLSKCYKIINRFSEDIDLTWDPSHFTQSQKRNVNKAVIAVCDELGLEIENRDQMELHSHGNYNCYMIRYPVTFSEAEIKPFIKLDMTFIQKAYPDDRRPVCSLIGEFLLGQNQSEAVAHYELQPYEMTVQALERTLIDKVFALCDYYLSGNVLRQSRHIYDIYKLLNVVNLKSINKLVRDVREIRKANKTCLSAQDGISVTSTLSKIIESEYYRNDYEEVTTVLLSENVDYETAAGAILKIIESKVFDG